MAAAASPPQCGSSYIGFVAVCDDERDIERLGRRDVVIASRGTVTCCEWVDNFKSGLTWLPTTTDEEEAMVEGGLWRLFTALGEVYSCMQQHGRCAMKHDGSPMSTAGGAARRC